MNNRKDIRRSRAVERAISSYGERPYRQREFPDIEDYLDLFRSRQERERRYFSLQEEKRRASLDLLGAKES